MTTALFIGRFQPFHNGHLSAIKEVLNNADKIIIGIGSSQHSNTKDNPFTFEKRFKMIENALVKEGIENFTIFPVPDIPDDKKWVEHVKSLLPRFDVVYSSNPLVARLFKEDKDYKKGKFKVKRVKIIKEASSTKVRILMKKGKGWKRLVPEEVGELIESIDGINRIKRL